MKGCHLMAIVLLAMVPGACGGGEPAREPDERRPSRVDMARLVSARVFEPEWTPGARRECIGRLVFETPGEIEWAVDPHEKVEHTEPPQFSDGVHGSRRERVRFGGMGIYVSRPATAENMKAHRDAYAVAERGGGVAAWERGVARREAELAEAIGRGASELVIAYHRDKLEDARNKLALAHYRRLHDFGLTDELSYESPSGTLTIRTLMGGRIVTVLTWLESREGDPDREARLAEVRSTLSRLRVRAPGEIPTEPGICMPYLFLADDGETDYQVRASFRYPDRPNVVYTVDTGYMPAVGAPEGAASIERSASAEVLRYPREMLRFPPHNLHRRDMLGPNFVQAGPHRFEQAGMVFSFGPEEGPYVRTYSIFSGASGAPGIQAVPFVFVRMRSWMREDFPQLEQEPPPVEESQERLAALPKNLHLRHTEPELPSFSRWLDDQPAEDVGD